METTRLRQLGFILIGGLALFALLAGLWFWQGARTAKNKTDWLALIDSAKQEEAKQNWDGCIQKFEDLYRAGSQEAFYRIFALHGMGICARGKGDTAGAIGFFERAAKEPGHEDPFASRYEAARSYALAGDSTKALEYYQQLLDDKQLTPKWKEIIEGDWLWLKLQAKR